MACLMTLLYNFSLCRSVSQISSFVLFFNYITYFMCVWACDLVQVRASFLWTLLSGWQQVPLPTEPSLRMITLKGCVCIKEFFKVEEMNLKVIQNLC